MGSNCPDAFQHKWIKKGQRKKAGLVEQAFKYLVFVDFILSCVLKMVESCMVI